MFATVHNFLPRMTPHHVPSSLSVASTVPTVTGAVWFSETVNWCTLLTNIGRVSLASSTRTVTWRESRTTGLHTVEPLMKDTGTLIKTCIFIK